MFSGFYQFKQMKVGLQNLDAPYMEISLNVQTKWNQSYIIHFFGALLKLEAASSERLFSKLNEEK